jgi:outer membrane receptor for Fe3+-dicitrate
MHRDRSAPLGVAALLLLAPAAHAEPAVDPLIGEAYLKEETSVASVRPATVRESPGVLTVLSRGDILASGARDLLDVLQLVPGFAPAVDVQGITDVGFRGVWGTRPCRGLPASSSCASRTTTPFPKWGNCGRPASGAEAGGNR